jgi:hypothetical protein
MPRSIYRSSRKKRSTRRSKRSHKRSRKQRGGRGGGGGGLGGASYHGAFTTGATQSMNYAGLSGSPVDPDDS